MCSTAGCCGEGRHRGVPTYRQHELYIMGPGCGLDEGQKGGRPVEEGEAVLDPVGAHRHLTAVEAVGHHERTDLVGVDTPAIFPGLIQAECCAIYSMRRYAFNVASVFTYQVRARRPHRHG